MFENIGPHIYSRPEHVLLFTQLTRYKVVDLLTIASKHQNAVLDPEHERPMLEGALTFLVVLLGVRLHLGRSAKPMIC